MIISSDFQAPWWLSNPHLQTIWGARFRTRPKTLLLWERLELPDGDFLDLTWSGQGKGPIVIILHGLEGSYRSRYASGMLTAIAYQGWRGVLMHFRGCSGEPNRLNRGYHSGDTVDFQTVLNMLQEREPNTPLAAIGYSLGGNVLLKWLGTQIKQNSLKSAVGVSIPFDLQQAAQQLSQRSSRIYQIALIRTLKRSMRRKFSNKNCPFNLKALRKVQTFEEFDNLVTAPLHGFKDAYDYWQQSSCKQFLAGIKTPTLILHSKDDPFLPQTAIPSETDLSDSVQLELSQQGGHVGFVSSRRLWNMEYWLDQRIIRFLQTCLR
ncbi:hydrolase [Candidatus Nitrosacidococcus tergens]|uniref:Putative esterase YheT n=1 Tax=Candidatus Nitrosacidococcus tergens TaxID=553981 RepID=A0A7G1Q9M0_9GAMM|nr:hydrolase [Candidatus Nitrosacidococcus tergens]CAB1275733.1 putative esterase YheT [Candidatus Nitrosacidococcus tergens]